MVEHSSTIPKVLEWSTSSQRLWVHKIPDSYSKREGGNPGNSGLSSQQQMVVNYPRTVWNLTRLYKFRVDFKKWAMSPVKCKDQEP